ncbi:glycosyltransferase family 4 protein [Gammaproteobacteria bacterium]|nr:glycosyltransferase family 4 protein [Gammaproteobacteria bacterium]
MNFAIFYAKEGYDISMPKLMGRNAAGASFIRGLLQYGRGDLASCLVESEEDAAFFKKEVALHSKNKKLSIFQNTQLKNISDIGGLYYPGPNISELAYHRASASLTNDSWSLCGITHTTSSARAMDSIEALITSPVQPWDSVICTSTAVKKNVEVVLQSRVDELRDRLGMTKIVLPMLPVIPLGVHTKDFNFSAQHRIVAREALNISAEAIIVLYTGRLSFHAKAHPLAMYQALERAANTTQKEVVLIECGWHANEFIESAFSAAAKLAAPSVRVITLDGRKEESRKKAWAGADVFCSLSDNIQETFGIVPIEAMAAGLPVVTSDWDGYKDSVREGIDGFRIPTIAPSPGSTGDLAHRHALGIDTYDMYCGHSSSLVAVHARKLTNAFISLFNSPELRRKMGLAGRENARQNYDWRSVIPLYEELWDEQTSIRKAAKKAREEGNTGVSTRIAAWPARLDPTIAFANYPTIHLSLNTRLILTYPSAAKALDKLTEFKKLAMVDYARYVFPTPDELKSVIEVAEKFLPGGSSAAQLVANIEPQRRPYVLRGLAWLCKLGFLEFV